MTFGSEVADPEGAQGVRSPHPVLLYPILSQLD